MNAARDPSAYLDSFSRDRLPPPELWRALEIPEALRNLRGSTEMLHAFVAAPAREAKPGSLGEALPGYRAQVVDEAMRRVAPGVAAGAEVGVPDEARGMIVKAFVAPAERREAGADLARGLQEHVRRVLAPYEYPRAVEFLDALPLTTTGEIQRSALRGGTSGGAGH